MLWNSSVLSGQLMVAKHFGIIVQFTSKHNNEVWTLVNVYGPCRGQARDDFVDWLYHLSIPDSANWLVLGDFNFIRSTENRNLPGGDANDIFIFNEIIGHLGLLELPIKGRSFTWSNMQDNPLLEQLDWFLLLRIGPPVTLPLRCYHLQGLLQIMCLVWWQSTPPFPNAISFVLRTIGWSCRVLLIV